MGTVVKKLILLGFPVFKNYTMFQPVKTAVVFKAKDLEIFNQFNSLTSFN